MKLWILDIVARALGLSVRHNGVRYGVKPNRPNTPVGPRPAQAAHPRRNPLPQ